METRITKVECHAHITETFLSLLCSSSYRDKYDQTFRGVQKNKHLLLYSAIFWPWHFSHCDAVHDFKILSTLWSVFMTDSCYRRWHSYHRTALEMMPVTPPEEASIGHVFIEVMKKYGGGNLFWCQSAAIAKQKSDHPLYAAYIQRTYFVQQGSTNIHTITSHWPKPPTILWLGKRKQKLKYETFSLSNRQSVCFFVLIILHSL